MFVWTVGHRMTQTGGDVISQVTESDTEEEEGMKKKLSVAAAAFHSSLFALI